MVTLKIDVKDSTKQGALPLPVIEANPANDNNIPPPEEHAENKDKAEPPPNEPKVEAATDNLGDVVAKAIPKVEPAKCPSATSTTEEAPPVSQPKGPLTAPVQPARSVSMVTANSGSRESLAIFKSRSSAAPFCRRLRAALIKATLVVFYMLTSLMLAAGSAMLAVGLTALVDEQRGNRAARNRCCDTLPPLTTIMPLMRALAILMMMAGCVIVLLGMLGFCGLLLRNKVMVASFGMLMLLIVLGQLNFGAVAFLHRDTLRCRLRATLLAAIRNHYDGVPNTTNPFSQAVDMTQLALGCCGVDSPSDFNKTPWFQKHKPQNMTVPWTCCQVQPQVMMACPRKSLSMLMRADCPFTAPGPNTPYTNRPCLRLVEERMRQHFLLLMGVLFSLTFLELMAMSSAFLAASSVGRRLRCSTRSLPARNQAR